MTCDGADTTLTLSSRHHRPMISLNRIRALLKLPLHAFKYDEED